MLAAPHGARAAHAGAAAGLRPKAASISTAACPPACTRGRSRRVLKLAAWARPSAASRLTQIFSLLSDKQNFPPLRQAGSPPLTCVQDKRGMLGLFNYLGDRLLHAAHLGRSNTVENSRRNIEEHYVREDGPCLLCFPCHATPPSASCELS